MAPTFALFDAALTELLFSDRDSKQVQAGFDNAGRDPDRRRRSSKSESSKPEPHTSVHPPLPW